MEPTIHLISGKGVRVDLHVVTRKELRPSLFLSWVASRRSGEIEESAARVLAMPFISPRLAELCRQTGWSWIDLAGNCRFDIPEVLHVVRMGNPPVHRVPRPGANLRSPASGRVVRVLLSPANAGRSWTHRQLQEETSKGDPKGQPASLGLVNKVLRHLRDEGYVASSDGGGARLRDPMGLLQEWSAAYRFDRHERRSYFTLLKRLELENALYKTGLQAGGWVVYAAFSAAERQAPRVVQHRTWIYVAPEFIDSMADLAQAKEVDSGENLVVLIPDDPGVFRSYAADTYLDSQSLGCTDPVQTYVDLLKCGGRGEEAAEAMLEQRLLPAWKMEGLA